MYRHTIFPYLVKKGEVLNVICPYLKSKLDKIDNNHPMKIDHLIFCLYRYNY